VGERARELYGALWTCLFLAAAACSPCAAQDRWESLKTDQCVRCHTGEDNLPADLSKEDVHLRPGLSCAGCHGGNPEAEDGDASMSPDAGFVGVPSKREIPLFCGKCHSNIEVMRKYLPRVATDQVEQYWTSQHGKLLVKGDAKVADCASCHSAHGILPASDSRSTVYPLNVPLTCKRCHGDPVYMKEYGIAVDQFDKFSRSVHGAALLEKQDTASPACNDCHGNHGAAPPNVTSITQICGQCHVNNLQYFSESKMARPWEKEGFHGCEECHGHHDIVRTFDDMVGTGEKSVCTGCHDQGDAGFAAAGDIRSLLAALTGAYDQAESKRAEVHRIGMEDEDIAFLLQEAHQDLVRARTLVHTFDPARVGEKTKEGKGKADEAYGLAVGQIKEFGVRRRGFGMATVFITLLIVALYLKIRQIERR
jgi:predicted CXXCH cytochrome family protein